MTGRVIQGFFPGGKPRLAGVAPAPAPAPALAQPKATANRVGPPRPAFVASAPVAQRFGGNDSFAIEPGKLGLATGGGRPLPDAVRGHMESALGADFSAVRVHVGPQAERIGAVAFTLGHDIYFAPGRFQPDTVHGRQLLGHELAHVVQQRQGRVRNPLGAGVAVVQDRALEAEADRLALSASAIAQRKLLQPKMAVPRVGPPAPAWSGQRCSNRSPKSTAIQRTIWKYDGSAWGVEEVGTEGGWPFPKNAAAGAYFNDVNNTYDADKEKVRADLSDLLMITGSLSDKSMDITWPVDLWNKLVGDAEEALCKEYGETNAADLPEDATFYCEFGHIKLKGKGETLKESFRGTTPHYLPWVKKAWFELLKGFMTKTGQLPYLKRQPWFKNGSGVVIIEVNFYYNRYGAEFSFHKDTAGDNLFVNLIFNNAEKILATEWIEDFSEEIPEVTAVYDKLVPTGVRQALERSRSQFASAAHKTKDPGFVRGGIAGTGAYVAWTDKHVWHSSPSDTSRDKKRYNMYHALFPAENYWTHIESGRDALFQLAQHTDTGIFQFARNLNNLTVSICDAYMGTVISKDGKTHGPNYNKLRIDCSKYEALLKDFPSPLILGVEVDNDAYIKDILDEPIAKYTGISDTIRRRNSFSENLVGYHRPTEKRSFIRTWVRIHKKEATYFKDDFSA